MNKRQYGAPLTLTFNIEFANNVGIFGQKGRMHRSHDSEPDIIAAVAERYRQQVDDHWQTVLKNIGRVKQDYQKNQNRQLGNENPLY
ncbi:hypothetical protein RJK31_004309 [Salmonella enterica]|nr:hypothetical protein [Salmonella enterica]ELC4946896.1 hypothetical protein [Salmonella enterica]HBJ6960973.1 hypothetical protein [Salmonella enterica subsp. enterica serovar Duisburg]